MHLLHTVFEPPGAGPHPTLLTLHGWGANALDLLGLAPYVWRKISRALSAGSIASAAWWSSGRVWLVPDLHGGPA